MDQIQAWQTLTATLSQTIEFNVPSPPPPWKLLSDQVKADVSASAEQDREISRLREEIAARNGTISMKDKALEELNVNVEVLNKRVTESQGRREQLRELELQLEERSRKEQEVAAELVRAQEDLRNLEAERENWSRYVPVADGSASDGVTGPTQLTSPTGRGPHAENLAQGSSLDIARLKEEIQTLQATIRHLRQSTYHTSLSKDNYSFLSTPLYPKSDRAQNSRLQFSGEIKDAFKTLLDVSVSDTTGVPEISFRDKAQRLNWRPAKETARWKVRQQMEDWEAWCEWRDDLIRRQKESYENPDVTRVLKRAWSKTKVPPKALPLARLGVNLPGKEWEGGSREVQIVQPENWSEIERDFGIA
jgi:dynactin 1